MLVLRKEIKIGIGAGLTILGIAAVYGLIAALSSGGADATKQTATNVGNGGSIAAVTDRGNGGGLPPKIDEPDLTAGKPETPVRDPFAESTRPDGNTKTDPWKDALISGRIGSGEPVKEPAVVKAPTAKKADAGRSTVADAPRGQRDEDMVPALDRANGFGNNRPVKNTVTPPATTSGRTYKIQTGDTFSTIAQKQYGSRAAAAAIIKANPDVNPNRLRVGKEINLPAKEEVATVGAGSIGRPAAEVSAPIDASRQYRIAQGDTLSSISTKIYRTSTNWEELYEANKATIGANPARLKLGTVIDLPQKLVR